MSNFYPNFNGYTQYYTSSTGNSGQSNNPFGSAASPYASFPNSSYGNYSQGGGAGSSGFSLTQNRSVAESFPSNATIPSVYNALLNPYGQNSPNLNFGQGAGAHGPVGAPVPKPGGVGLIKQPNLGTGASYDHLVYNTAAQMIQQQHQAAAAAKAPLASLNPRFPPKPGRGSFPPKKGHYSKDVQQLYCEICKITCAGQQTLKEHLEGQKHKKKEALLKGEQPQSIPKNKVSFRCDLCNVTCTGQDTYNAHVRGTKHQKTFALVKKRGGEMPPTEPTIIPPSEYQARAGYAPPPPPPPPPSDNEQAVSGMNKARVVGIATVSFVSSSKLNCSQLMENKKYDATSAVSSAGMTAAEIAISSQSDEIKAMIAAEKTIAPVGEDYIESEKDAAGRLIQYICKLCDCKFSDPNAKEIHLKGRKHRMQYKLKVDPTLEVETKVPANRRIAARFGGPTRPVPSLLNSIPPWFGVPGLPPRPNLYAVEARRYETVDDRHIQAKDSYIFPDEQFLSGMTVIVMNVEGTMRLISDHFMETRPVTKREDNPSGRLLHGVERVGLLSKKLLIKGDTEVELVGLFSEIPTPTILQEVADLFKQKYQSCCEKDKGLNVIVSDPSVLLSFEGCKDLTVRITLTSKFLREPTAETAIPNQILNKERCLDALAQVRRAKWFSARCFAIQSCNLVIRVLRDLRTRRPAWESLTDWMLQLLAEKILMATPNQVPLGYGDAFRRIIEAVASGFLSPLGPGLPDPCEKGNPDVTESLTGQQREDLMFDAQQCLRMIGFNQIYKVLGIERLPDVRPPLGDRKRPLEEINGISDEVKKDKKDGEDGENLNEPEKTTTAEEEVPVTME